MTPALYRSLTMAGGPAIALLLAWRRRHGKEDAARSGERVGRPGRARPPGALVWLHAASMGEAQAALALIARLLAFDARLAVLVTTGTVTSARLMAERLPPRACHQYAPVDLVPAVRRFLDHWRPDLALWLESELWPNLVLETARRRVPMLLINARMSERSFAGWRRWPRLVRPLLDAFALVLAQSEADAGRFRALGARRVTTTGVLKYDAEPLPADPEELARMAAMLGERPRWLAASTHPGEEAVAAEAHRALKRRFPGLVTIIAPRHPERGPALAVELAGRGFAVARRKTGEPIGPSTDIYLGDSLGELGLFYRLASVVLVGGSLVAHGGQNMLEPARLGCAILRGPHVENFREVADALDSAGAAVTVRDAVELAREVGALLNDERLRWRRSEAARLVAESGRGVLDRVTAELDPWLVPLMTPVEAGRAHA